MAGDRSPAPHAGGPGAGRPGVGRRQFLLGGAVAGVGAAGAIGADLLIARPPGVAGTEADPAREAATALNGALTEPFHGDHQSGIETPPQAHAVFLALDLRDGVDRDALTRMMRILSDDASRLTRGDPALADTEPELALAPARLTVTFGFGPWFVQTAGATGPEWLRPLPAFGIDRLRADYSDGDLLLQIAADDPITVSHAARMLLKDSRAFATVRWSQTGFRRAHGTEPTGTTMRNLFGQVDGTVNPPLGSADFARIVWGEQPGWLAGGTGMVLRRIAMDLDTWDELDRPGREQAIGRDLDTGAPLTGTAERDAPDFEATGPAGFPVIPDFSHLRRATGPEKIFRRGYNYDDPPQGASVSNAGLLFASFQADVDAQFVPIQRRLDALDILNRWTTPIGSSVFAIPPGCAEGGFVGETILG